MDVLDSFFFTFIKYKVLSQYKGELTSLISNTGLHKAVFKLAYL